MISHHVMDPNMADGMMGLISLSVKFKAIAWRNIAFLTGSSGSLCNRAYPMGESRHGGLSINLAFVYASQDFAIEEAAVPKYVRMP